MATNKNKNTEVVEKPETATTEESAPKKNLEEAFSALKAEFEALKTKDESKMTNAAADVPEVTGPKIVKIKIPKTKEKKDDVFVSVNFRTYQIQRGVEVEVPDFVYEVLQNQEKMLEEIMLFEERVQKGK